MRDIEAELDLLDLDLSDDAGVSLRVNDLHAYVVQAQAPSYASSVQDWLWHAGHRCPTSAAVLGLPSVVLQRAWESVWGSQLWLEMHQS